MDAYASIGRPPAEGIVRLRLPSPTVKQSTGLFYIPSCACLCWEISRSAERDEGSAPRPRSLERLANFLSLCY